MQLPAMMYIMATSSPRVLSSLEMLGLSILRSVSCYRTQRVPFNRAVLHNPDDYPDPEVFNPSRYLTSEGALNPSVRDPRIACFGFGRRICPGIHVADASLFAMVSTLLATVDIIRAKDANGNEVVPEVDVTTGILSHPKPFPWAVQPRSQHAEELLLHSLANQ
jgi:hypothetical protein